MATATKTTGQYKASLELLQTARRETISLVEGLSQEQMGFSPAAGKWSVGEILDHLLLSEKLYRRLIAELIKLAKEGKRPYRYVGVREVNFSPFFLPKSFLPMLEIPLSMMNLFVPKAVLDFLLRYNYMPGQNPDVALPAKGRAAADLVQGLKSAIQETTALLESNPDLDYQQMRSRHPMLGTNDVPGLLRVTALHEQRHGEQISEILKNPRFPKAGC